MITWENVAVCDECAGRIQLRVWEHGRYGFVWRLLRRWGERGNVTADMLRVLPPALVLSLVGAPHVRDALNALGRAELARPLLSLGVFTVTVVVTTLMLTLLPYALPAGSRLAHVVTAGAWALAGALVGGQLSTTAAVAGGILALFSWLLVSAVTGNYSRQDIN